MPTLSPAKSRTRQTARSATPELPRAPTPSAAPRSSPGLPLFLQRKPAAPIPAKGPPLPPKLIVNHPDDGFEHEADAVAERATSTATAPIRSAASTAGTASLTTSPGFEPPDAGVPLSGGLRDRIEPHLGIDLDSVRIHESPTAQATAAQLGARAFTHGNHIWLGPGESRADERLIAHESTHVAQQRAGGGPGGNGLAIQRVPAARITAGDEVSADAATELDLVRETIAVGCQQYLFTIASATEAPPPEKFSHDLAKEVIAGVTDPTDAEHAAVEANATAVSALQEQFNSGVLTIPDALHRLAAGRKTGSATLAVIVYSMSRHMGDLFVSGLDRFKPAGTPDPAGGGGAPGTPAVQTLLEGVRGELVHAEMALTSEHLALQLELEGTLALLIDRRRAFQRASDQPTRAKYGQEIGTFSRQALLLNERLQRVDEDDPTTATSPTALDEALRARAAEIDDIARAATEEAETMQRLGDNLSLLGLQDVVVANPEFPAQLQNLSDLTGEKRGASILPEQAFPSTLDYSLNRMVRDLDERLQSQSRDVARLRGAVIPSSPNYTLEEFAGVFRRWASFFSTEQEMQDPGLRMIMEMLGEPFRMLGSAALEAHPDFGKISAVEGAMARHLLMATSVGLLDQLQPMMSPMKLELGRAATNTPRREESVQGSALEVDYAYGQLFPGAGGGKSTAGEVANRTNRSAVKRQQTAIAFSVTAAMPPDLQPAFAAAQKIAPDDRAPLVAMRRVDAREGWSMLVDIFDPVSVLTGNPMVVEREHKVLPTEVVDYLMAVEQYRTTLAAPHQPRYGGRVIGDAPTRGTGIEKTSANNVAHYFEGGFSPKPSDEALSLSQTRSASLQQVAGWGMRPEDPRSADPTTALIRSLEGYINAYFEQPPMQQTVNRIATVLVIASAQYGAADQAKEITDPRKILKALGEAATFHSITKIVSRLGSIGKLVGHGFSSYLSVNGVSNIAAAQGLFSFLLLASEADSFPRARARARLVANFLSDLQELFDGMLSSAVTKSIDVMAEHVTNPPSTPRELADFCQPMMENPKSRAVLLEGVDSQLREMEAARDFDRLQPSEDYRQLRAFREQLAAQERGVSSRGSIDADLPLRRDRTEEENLGRVLSRRTTAERAALVEALGPYQHLPLIENPDLGNAVRIHYDGGELRVEVGPEAKPERVRAHQNTIKQLKRYDGTMGRVRRLFDRTLSLLRLRQAPEFGTLGHEAQLEVEKLQGMLSDLQKMEGRVNERAGRLSSDEQLASHRAEQAEIARDIEGLQRQLAHYETLVSSAEAGRGFVASEDTTGKALAADVRKAEATTRTHERAVDQAREALRSRQETERAARVARQQAMDRLAEAKEYEKNFGNDPDPQSRRHVQDMLAKARNEVTQAEQQWKKSRDEITAQRKSIEAAELRLHEVREAEVDVAKKHLELELADLYGQRTRALAEQREAESDLRRIGPELSRAQGELNTAQAEERRRPPPNLQGLTKDQQIAAYNTATALRTARLKPLQEAVDRLSAEQQRAQQRAATARQQRADATESINHRVTEFEIRQAAAVGITRERYELLRGRTPNSARQSAAQASLTDAIYGTPIAGTPQADHIVPMFEIVRMPGFNRLTQDQQLEILNDPANFWALDPRVNASKGHRSLREWRGHPDANAFPAIPDDHYDKLIDREDAAREHLRLRVQALQPPVPADNEP